MKLYEHTVITKPNLTKSQLEEVHNNLKSLIEKNSGKIIKLEEWGMLNFSQPIKKTKKRLGPTSSSLVSIRIKN